jgi:hypothetical protein
MTPRRQNAAQTVLPSGVPFVVGGAQHSHVQFYGKRQGGPIGPHDFSVADSLFLRRRKTRKIGVLCKNCSENSDWTLG